MALNICVITGSRAEYGLLKPLIEEIQSEVSLNLRLVVTGMHLSPEFGLTYQQIEKDGLTIHRKIETLLSSDTPVGIAKSMGIGIIGFADAFEELKPDIILVLGDRFEIFSAVSAALVARIPVAHIHGGEITEGAFDDSLRHCITKMSHLHFTSTGEYRRRVIQLGESPERVFNVGAIGLDNINRLALLGRNELENELGIKFAKRNFLVTFHPVTLERNTSESQFNELLEALDDQKDAFVVFTRPNADTDGRIINKMIDEYTNARKGTSKAFASLGQLRYLSLMSQVDAVIGNSSSGIIESPSFKIGTINIGDRQRGRIKAESVIDCEPFKQSIRDAIEKLFTESFRNRLKNIVNPYGKGDTAKKIVAVLKNIEPGSLYKKKFYNIQESDLHDG